MKTRLHPDVLATARVEALAAIFSIIEKPARARQIAALGDHRLVVAVLLAMPLQCSDTA